MTQETPKEYFSNERVEAALAEFRRKLATTLLDDWKKETLLTAMENAARSNALSESEERAFCGKALAEFDFELAAPPTNRFEQTFCDLSFELRETRLEAVAPSLSELRRRWAASNANGGENGENGESGESGESGGDGSGLFGGDIDESENASLSRWRDGNDPNGKKLGEPNPGDRVRIIVELENGASASEDYVVEELVGRGGQKQVFSLRQEGTGSRLAFKQALGSGRATRRAFAQEAKAQGILEHPNIPTLFWADVSPNGDSNEPPILIESFVPGEPWSARAFDRESREENLAILLKIATIMTYVHRQAGVVHRDLKPANVMLGKYEEIYLCDWGLASLAGKEEGATRSGGTLAFIAPEQARGETVDFRADVFSLGAILYKILSGVAPHEATGKYSLKALFERAKAGTFDMLEPNAGPAELRIVALKALSRDPEERYADAGEFADALTTYLRRSKIWERFEKLTFRLACLREEFETADWSEAKEKRDVWAVRLNTGAALLIELTALRRETDEAAEDAGDRELKTTLLGAEINARSFLIDKMIQWQDLATATALRKDQLKAIKRRFEISADAATYNNDVRKYKEQGEKIQIGVDELTVARRYQILAYILIVAFILGFICWSFMSVSDSAKSSDSRNDRSARSSSSTNYEAPPIVIRDADFGKPFSKKKGEDSRLSDTEDWKATLGLLLTISRLKEKLDASELKLLEREADVNVANETIRKLRQQLAEAEAAEKSERLQPESAETDADVETDADGETLPSESAESPAAGEAPPPESAETDADVETLPSESAETDADGETLPSESAESPADGETLPSENVETDADGETLPSESAASPAAASTP